MGGLKIGVLQCNGMILVVWRLDERFGAVLCTTVKMQTGLVHIGDHAGLVKLQKLINNNGRLR